MVPAVGIVTARPHPCSNLRIIRPRHGRRGGGGQAALAFRRVDHQRTEGNGVGYGHADAAELSVLVRLDESDWIDDA
jgi:hypothetical protein